MIQSLQNMAAYLLPPTITEPAFSRGQGYWSNPGQEKLTDFFGKLTDVNSQRESWYQVTPYVAEFWCTVSNVAIIGSGIVNKSPELVFAGVASTVSHSIPKQWLLTVDKLGVGLVALRVLRNYQAIRNNPSLLLPLAGALGLNMLDTHLARTTGATWPHIVWHCASGVLAGYFLSQLQPDKLSKNN